MQFLASGALAFAVIIPIILVFYLLRQKRQDLVVSSNLLWQKVLADSISQTPWQKLRRNLLLFLQLLLAILLVLALMRPFLPTIGEKKNDLILLIDSSASMGAVEGGKTRLDLAKKDVEKLVAGQQSGTEFTLIEVGPVPKVLISQSDKPKEVISKVKSLQPGLHVANLEATFSLVAALLAKGKQTEVVFYSDGGVELSEAAPLLGNFRFNKVGKSYENLAIGAFSAQKGPEGPIALTRVDNHGSKTLETIVKFFAGDKLHDLQVVKVAAGESAHLFWSLPTEVPFLEARLDLDDGLQVDNSAWLVPRQEQQTKALLVTKGNIFLEQILKLNSSIELDKVNPEAYLGLKEKYQLYIMDNFWPKEIPAGQLIIVNPPVTSGLVEKKEDLLTGKLRPAKEDSLLRHVSWADVHIAKGKGLKDKGEWRPLLTSNNKAVITVGEIGRARAAVFGFDLHQSDFPLRPAYPILMQNLLTWLIPPGALRDSEVAVNTPVNLSLHPQATEALVEKPDGSSEVLTITGSKFSNTQQPGIYKVEQLVKGEKKLDYLAVNFNSPQESKLKPKEELKLGHRSVKAEAITKANREFWPWLAVGALLVLSIEWWVYLRGH